MSLIEKFGLSVLHKLDPEQAHSFSLTALRSGLVPMPTVETYPRLATSIAGLELANPVGLAAGYDKNAVAITALSKVGFGFVEVGAATPRAQPGNPKPRLFRLSEDKAAINRFGFNNEGAQKISERLKSRPRNIPFGLNLGANKDSADKASDFATVLKTCGANVDFATVNVSSPNTEKLRDLQGAEALLGLLNQVLDVRDDLRKPIPVFLKIAPDLNDSELSDIAGIAKEAKIDGIIATNTTLDRDGLSSQFAGEAGGLSGQPLFEKSTRILAQLSRATEGQIPLIGVGGVSNADQAWEKIRAGASAVQIYTSLVYGGFSLVPAIVARLNVKVKEAGLLSIQDAVGKGTGDWL